MKIINKTKYLIIFFIIACVLQGCVSGAPVLVQVGDSGKESAAEGTEPEDESEKLSAGTVFVHISGAVNNPGLYELDEGARLYDAVCMAGGFSDEADSDYANLAEVLTDGTKYVIYTKEETEMLREDSRSDGGTLSHYTDDGLLDINLATTEEFMLLSGIGRVKAEAIVKHREENGPFASKEDIKNVNGIGDGTYAGIEDYITVR